jgi:hypothetical protein
MINEFIAKTAFNQSGLNAMGPASGQLASKWGGSIPSYDATAMTLSLPEGTSWFAMIGGMFIWHAFGASELTDATGRSLSGVVGVLHLHPQAALRIKRLIGARFDGRTDSSALRPTPYYAAIRGGKAPDEVRHMVENDPPLAPIDGSVGRPLTHGILTFHDEQGLIIDPIAVACLFRDLMRGFPALRNPNAGPLSDLSSSETTPGGIGSICSLGIGRRLHIVNIFGGPWLDRQNDVGLRLSTGTRLDSGPHDWADGQTLNTTTINPGDLRFGFSPHGTLATTALSPPTLPTSVVPPGSSIPVLEREFFRVIAVNLSFHLKGNRTANTIEEVTAADNSTVLEPSPIIRDDDFRIDFLRDGQTVLGAMTEVTLLAGLHLAVSPTIDTAVAFPSSRADRWPVIPATTETPESLNAEHSKRARTDVSGSYVGTDGPDVVLSWPAGSLPAEAHIRVFPRVDPGPAVIPLAELDFSSRGDGSSGISKVAGLNLLVKDPYRVGTGRAPTNPTLRFDLLIVTRAGVVRGRLFGGLEVNVGTGATKPPETSVTNTLDALPLTQRGISPAPLLGFLPTSPATGTNPLLASLGEAAPRESPRFRTMARTETVVAGHDGGSPGVWQSVLTAGFLNVRSVRGDAHLGNPGNPTGPEDHVLGVLTSGHLGLDLARSALRRTHHLVTRLPELNEAHWNDSTTGSETNFVGTVLQNIAPITESPELDLIPESTVHSLPENWDELIAAIQPFLPPQLGPLITSIPATDSAARWVAEVRREAFAAKHGRRDSQWSWKWAISHARHLIYLETPLFCATAAGTSDHEVDLIGLLRTRLTTMSDLRVIIATPKRIPFGPGYESFAQRLHLSRNEAVASLRSVAPKRVAVYHPIGFPGRPEVIRGTLAVVDDVWALIGSSSFSRRGLTFDGSIDIALLDKVIKDGVSDAVRNFRRLAMANTLGLVPPVASETAKANWVRLSKQKSAFELIREIIERGGDGLVEPLWPGLPETELLPVDEAIANPEGRGFSVILGTFADVLAGLGQDRV